MELGPRQRHSEWWILSKIRRPDLQKQHWSAGVETGEVPHSEGGDSTSENLGVHKLDGDK
jgi:hypothetical protein